MPAYGFASFEDRERDVREAAARWADRGLAVRFGVEITYERGGDQKTTQLTLGEREGDD